MQIQAGHRIRFLSRFFMLETKVEVEFNEIRLQTNPSCRELTTLWVARLDDGTELKVTDPKEQQGDVEEKEAKGKKRWDGVNCGRRGTSC